MKPTNILLIVFTLFTCLLNSQATVMMNLSVQGISIDDEIFPPQAITVKGSGGVVSKPGEDPVVCPNASQSACYEISLWDAIRVKWNEIWNRSAPTENPFDEIEGVTVELYDDFMHKGEKSFLIKKGALVTRVNEDLYYLFKEDFQILNN